MERLRVISGAVLAFAATNIDDIFVLTLFFAQKTLKSWQIVLGQYLGVGALIGISLAGFFARLIVPEAWLTWLGLGPLIIGIKKLIEWKQEKQPDSPRSDAGSVLSVWMITFANGGDNIAVYTPLFASSNAGGLALILAVFGVMIGVWCVVGYFIGKHPLVMRVIDRYGHILVPFVLIALGLYILFG